MKNTLLTLAIVLGFSAVVGAQVTPGTDGRYYGVAPVRIITNQTIAAGQTIPVFTPSQNSLRVKSLTRPAGANGVILQITIANPTANGHVIVWSPEVGERPNISVLNYETGHTISGMTIVFIKTENNTVNLWSLSGAQLYVDLLGYFVQ